jgi:hypothetical protein
MGKDAIHAYQMPQRTKHFYVICVREVCIKVPQMRLIGIPSEVSVYSEEPQHDGHRSIDDKHTSLYVKFEVGLSIPFAIKLMPKKSGTFS